MSATLPDAPAERLKLYLDATASPRVSADEAVGDGAHAGSSTAPSARR